MQAQPAGVPALAVAFADDLSHSLVKASSSGRQSCRHLDSRARAAAPMNAGGLGMGTPSKSHRCMCRSSCSDRVEATGDVAVHRAWCAGLRERGITARIVDEPPAAPVDGEPPVPLPPAPLVVVAVPSPPEPAVVVSELPEEPEPVVDELPPEPPVVDEVPVEPFAGAVSVLLEHPEGAQR